MRYMMIFSLSIFLTTGCSTAVRTQKVLPTDSKIPSGVIYNLPATSIDATLTFLPTQCYTIDSESTIEYDLIGAQIKQRFVPDPKEEYVLDYTDLNSKLKITTANITFHPSGMLKSFNADVDDRTAQVLASVAGVAINIAKAAAFPGMTFVAAEGERKKCPAPIADRLSNLAPARNKIIDAGTADEELEGKQAELSKAQRALDAANAKLTLSPQDSALQADVKLKELIVARLTADLKDKKRQLPNAQAEWDTLIKSLTAKASITWTPMKPGECKKTALKFIDYASQLIDPKTTSQQINDLKNMQFSGETAFEGWVCIKAVDPEPPKSADPVAEVPGAGVPDSRLKHEKSRASGLIYRTPRMAKIDISKSKDGQTIDIVGDTWISFPQFGTKASLPLENGPFDKNTIKVLFAEDGSLASLDFTAQSSAERGAAAMEDLSKSYVTLLSERDKSRKARIEARDTETKKLRDDEIANYDAQINNINKLRELQAARRGNKDQMQVQIDSTGKETELIGKQIELEKKRQELEKLKNQKI